MNEFDVKLSSHTFDVERLEASDADADADDNDEEEAT